jgi:hypothetical protein
MSARKVLQALFPKNKIPSLLREQFFTHTHNLNMKERHFIAIEASQIFIAAQNVVYTIPPFSSQSDFIPFLLRLLQPQYVVVDAINTRICIMSTAGCKFLCQNSIIRFD